ncbi:patatin-like phospholipase family protein [bacterium]|nr:patatin-like phospholipase family protein [bacterium]
MLKELLAIGITPDFVVGASVGALNASFFAGDPTPEGVLRLEAIWRGLTRREVFPLSFSAVAGVLTGRRDGLVDPSGLRRLIERHLSFEALDGARVPLHVVATDEGGESVCLSEGPAVDLILVSAAIPVVFPPVEYRGRRLMDGAIGGNTPIITAANLGASRIIVLPTGYSCAPTNPARGPVARGLHALTLLITQQMLRDLNQLMGKVEVFTIPPLCPLDISPFDFNGSQMLIERGASVTRDWLARGGLSTLEIPHELMPHTHTD